MKCPVIATILLSSISFLSACSGMGEPNTDASITAKVNEHLRPANRPNIIIIFADDLGYGDIKSFDVKGTETPNIDSIGDAGFISRDFFIPANVCSPSRASLLTGRYPMRNGVPVAVHGLTHKHLESEYGLPSEEITIPEILKPAGYKSLMVGKWHLGFTNQGSHPLDAGFDQHLGIHANYAKVDPENATYALMKDKNTLYQGRQVIGKNMEMEELTTLYTDEVISFIEQEKDRPFFIYFAHNIVHSPHLPSEEFDGTTENGPYGDFINELDHSTGRILNKLEELGIEDNTIVIFTSDNGANFKGSNAPLNGGKYTTMEGGHIVPAMFKWPNVIPSGVDSNINLTLMDLFPLIADIAKVELPEDRIIDGKNILPVLKGESDSSPHDVLYYYNGINLQAIRKGKWKLHLPRSANDQPFWNKNSGGSRVHVETDSPLLFNLETDRAETINLANQYPEIVASFQADIEHARTELGDINIIGSDQRVPPFEEVQEIDRWWQN